MPIIKTGSFDSDLNWGVWKIEEELSDLKDLVHYDTSLTEILDTAKSNKKILETLCSRILLQKLAVDFNIKYQGIFKDDHGKPFLISNSEFVSISHSYPYVGCSINRLNPTGIDVEHYDDKIKRIEHKFLGEQETFDANHNVKKLITLWAAKEALYKFYGRRSLIFKEDLEISPFEMRESGMITGKIKKDDEIIVMDLQYFDYSEYVVVVTLN